MPNNPIPLPEYPRPSLRRENWCCLNGPWWYTFTDSAQQPKSYLGYITVPYSPETPLAGAGGRQLRPGEWLHYLRGFVPPPGTGGRVLLHFGAVDWQCRVWVNGRRVGRHTGGYLPFTLDITGALKTGINLLRVAVQDPSDAGHQARGKQKLNSGGMFYPAQSGIWQTVWLERVPELYLKSLKITPLFAQRRVRVQLETSQPEGAAGAGCLVVARKDGRVVAQGCPDAGGAVELPVDGEDFRPWSPEDPFLYALEVTCGQDTVQSYFAMREFSVQEDANGIPRFFLNGKPYFLHGLLDQGYWKGGLYTPPSDAAMEADIRAAKSLGFNLLRKHAKIEPERWYYHCDRLGMVVWQDMPNGGGRYKLWFVTYLTNLLQPVLRGWGDGNRALLARTDEKGRAAYSRELGGMVRQLYNHPCIGCWVPFNEGWGQFETEKATALVRRLDPTRPVDEASGWYDQGGGEVYSVHNYFYPLRLRPHKPRVVALTEYGGIAWACPGHCDAQKTYGYGCARSGPDLAARYRRLVERSVLPQIKKGLSALVYTQLSDVEEEVNGVLTYDRAVTKLDRQTACACADALRSEFARCVAPAADR